MKLSTAEMYIEHEPIAKGLRGLGPFLPVPVHAEETNKSVQVGPGVGLLHIRELEQVLSGLRAQAIHELYRLEVGRVVGGFVPLHVLLYSRIRF